MIDQNTIDKVVDAAQIYDVVSEFVSLRRRGQNYVGLCPFHADKSPSFYVSPAKNVCKCFACGEGGTPVSFLMKKEQMTFYEAIHWLGEKYNIEVKERALTDEERAEQTVRESLFLVNEFAEKCFEDDLFNSTEGRAVGLAYFHERGLQDATIRRFHLGYALLDREDLARRALNKGLRREHLLDGTGVGLCYGDDPSRLPVCRFAGRVIFPHHAITGRCIAFGGRILQRVDHAFKKYVNSPESAIYHKSDLPYGLFEAKSAIARENLCYVVEGNIDVLSMSQAGFQNVIAASGTALTSSHIRIIQRYTKNCVLMFDADSAGINATLKSIDLMLLEGMNVSILALPKGEDPDSFCSTHTTTEAAEYFKTHQEDFVTYKTRTLSQDINLKDAYQVAQVAQQVANSVALVSEPITRSVLIGQTSQLLHLDERNILQYVNQAELNNYRASVRADEIERRRQQAQQERAELGLAEQHTHTDTPTDTPAASADATPAETSVTETANPFAVKPAKTPESTPLPFTALYEQQLIYLIIRYGGETFDIEHLNEETKEIEKIPFRVIDFIYDALQEDGIQLQVPLYARIYQRALDASANEDVPFNSVQFFNNLYDEPDIQQAALQYVEDKYEAQGIARQDSLAKLVPRYVCELREAILHQEIEDLLSRLRFAAPTEDTTPLLLSLIEKRNLEMQFLKVLGERIVLH